MSHRKKSTEPIVRANDELIKYLIDYMGRHKEFAAGRFLGVRGKIKLNEQWESLTKSLNEIGPTKTPEKWQNVWKNQKYHSDKQINTNVAEYTDFEVAMLDEEMNNFDNSEIFNGNRSKGNNELHKSDYQSLKPTMSNNSKKPKLDTYMDLVKGTNDCFMAIAASLDKLATAMENSSDVINHGLMNIDDAISKHA